VNREEYEALIKQREEIGLKLEQLGWHACAILDALGISNDGEAKVFGIEGDRVEIRYLKPGCHGSCCGKDYGYKKFSVSWLFSENGPALAKAAYEEGIRTAKEIEAKRLVAEAEAERIAQEQRDREEFERLKTKFDHSTEKE
jgi:hypothetical protein